MLTWVAWIALILALVSKWESKAALKNCRQVAAYSEGAVQCYDKNFVFLEGKAQELEARVKELEATLSLLEVRTRR